MSQVVVITGASSGIGRATALEFARRGARLVLGSRHEGTAASLTRELGDERAVFKQSDVTSERDMQARAIAWVASPEASFVTAVLPVNGGMCAV